MSLKKEGRNAQMIKKGKKRQEKRALKIYSSLRERNKAVPEDLENRVTLIRLKKRSR